ncbi:MAG: hypothetical protein P9M06_05150 [Candidatus Saelkia tenebricola]|nr:hypothetical protein [Candidatus Saelkia tenebricola]
MNDPRNRRKKLFANNLHKQIFLLIALSALLPMIIAAICMYYLIFGITAMEVGIPETIAYNILPAARRVTVILSIAAPIVIFAILVIAHKMTHSIVGPFDRIVRELNDHLEGKGRGPIILRKNDKFSPLVDNVNKLLDKIKTD